MPGRIADEVRNSKPLASLEVEAALNIRRTGGFLAKWTNEGEAGHPPSEVRARMIQDAGRLPAILHVLRGRKLVEGTLRITITTGGREVLASIDGVLDRALRERFSRVDAATLRTVIDVMERLRA